MSRKLIFQVIRQLSGTPSVLDGVRRLLPILGEQGILPGLMIDSIARPGERRSEGELEEVISQLDSQGLGSSRVVPRQQADFYRRQTGMTRDMNYYKGGEDPIRKLSTGGNLVQPSQPFRPGGRNTRPSGVRSPVGAKIVGKTMPRIQDRDVRRGEGIELPQCWQPRISVESSHIYSMQYNMCSKQLVVTFRTGKGPMIDPKNTIPSMCSGKIWQWMQKPSDEGISYIYGNPTFPFPESLYTAFRDAPSKGRFLGENIRGCCGSRPYPYSVFDMELTADGNPGGIFLPTYGGEQGGIDNSPSPSPRS